MRRVFTNAKSLISNNLIHSNANGTSYFLANLCLQNVDEAPAFSKEFQLLSQNFALQETLRQLDFENGNLAGMETSENKNKESYEKNRANLVGNMNFQINQMMLFLNSQAILTDGMSANHIGKIFSLLANNVVEQVFVSILF